MSRYINQPIVTKVQVLDANGDPATTATVNYIVYDELNGVFSSGVMAHIANGIFTKTWTPDLVGTWTFESYSANPKFRDTRTYNVDWGADWLTDYDNPSFGSLVAKTTIVETHQPFILEHIYIGQQNDEVAAKNFDVWITQDDRVYFGAITIGSGIPESLLHSETDTIIQNIDGINWGTYTTLTMDDASTGVLSIPDPGCMHLKIEVQMTSVAGTSQTTQISMNFRTKGVYTPD